MKVLDHGSVELIETWGSDERIIEAARMSTGHAAAWRSVQPGARMSVATVRELATRHGLNVDELIEAWGERAAIRQSLAGFGRRTAEVFAIGDVERMYAIGMHCPETRRRWTGGGDRGSTRIARHEQGSQALGAQAARPRHHPPDGPRRRELHDLARPLDPPAEPPALHHLRLAHRSCNEVRGNDPIEETP